MRSTVLRQSELPHLPDNWELSAVEALAEINPEVLGAATPQWFKFKYIDLSAVSKGSIDWSLVPETVFREAPSRARRLVRGGDVLFGTVRPALQSHAAIPPDQEGPLVASTGFAVIRARPEVADSRFLFNSVLSYLFSLQARRTEVGSNYPAVNESDVRTFLVPHPDLTEQRRIAAILDTLDDTIRRTEQVMAKLQQMKQGLLHDLLTRGVDEHGDLRPLPEEAPHLYKDSPLGRIPRAWEATDLGTVASWRSGGTPAKSNPMFWDGTIPWVSPKDMKRFLLSDTEDHVTELGASVGTPTVPAGAIFVVVRGMILAHTFPVCVATREMAFNQDVKAIVPGPGVDGGFLAYWFVGNANSMLRLVTEATHGTKRIDLKELTRHRLALPQAPEAERISNRLAAQDVAIRLLDQEGKKLRTLKRGLLHDLLTGRVRVPLPAEATA